MKTTFRLNFPSIQLILASSDSYNGLANERQAFIWTIGSLPR